MIRIKHKTITFVSGVLWFVIGTALLILGLNFLMYAAKSPDYNAHPFIHNLSKFFGEKDNVIIVLITLSLLIGYVKGRYALGKSAQKIVKRIVSLPNPCSILKVYPFSYYLLVGLMVLIGISFNYFEIPKDIRGFIDVAIGSALINGAIVYFRLGMTLNNNPRETSERFPTK